MMFGLVVFTVYDAAFSTKLTIPEIYSLINLFNSFVLLVSYYMQSRLNKADAEAAAERLNFLMCLDEA